MHPETLDPSRSHVHTNGTVYHIDIFDLQGKTLWQREERLDTCPNEHILKLRIVDTFIQELYHCLQSLQVTVDSW